MPLPDTALVGDTGHVADHNLFQVWIAAADAAWSSYTPSLTQGATLTKSVGRANWKQVGKTVTVQLRLSITSAGTAASTVIIGLPTAAASALALDGCGSAWFFDAAPGTLYKMVVRENGTSTIRMQDVTTGYFGTDPAITAASGDTIMAQLTYEAA